ncbi:MAG: rod shape-determining protein MreD [Desulfobulbaceae bacterium]|nr:rod shape-determining protein MreD [Desulfobulbaceae bacterium]
MLIFSFLILGATLLTIQTTLFTMLPTWMGNPDLLFLLIVFIAIRFDVFPGAVLALLFGMMTDIFAGVFLGLFPVIYLLLFFMLQGISRLLIIDESVHQAPLAAASYLFTNSCIFLFAKILAPDSPLTWSWSGIILGTLILAVIAIPFYHFCAKIQELAQNDIKKRSFLRSKTGNRFRA